MKKNINEILKKYPVNIQDRIIDLLQVYPKVYVYFYDGEYHLYTKYMFFEKRTNDFRSFRPIKDDDIYTDEEISEEHLTNYDRMIFLNDHT